MYQYYCDPNFTDEQRVYIQVLTACKWWSQDLNIDGLVLRPEFLAAEYHSSPIARFWEEVTKNKTKLKKKILNK